MSLYDKKHKRLVRKIKSSRVECELTQVQLSQILKKSQSYVSKLESGQLKIDVLLLDELAKIFNKKVNTFLE